jgi:hypothetical protein
MEKMEQDKEIKNRIVETYAGDMAEVIENNEEGPIKKIIYGEEKHEEEKENLSPESKKNKLFMFAGFLLLSVALITLFYFLLFDRDIGTVEVEQQFTPIIFNDKSTFLEVFGLKKEEITQAVLNQINATEVKNEGIEGIYLTENKQIIGLRRFISLINGNFVPGNNPLFIGDNFLLGVVNVGITSPETPRPGFFILLKMRATTDIFDTLRIWEGKMFSDLYRFLGINLSKDTNYLLTKEFQNEVIENKNARVLYDREGKIVIMYIFANDNSVIVSNSKAAAHEIMLRLTSAQKEQ